MEKLEIKKLEIDNAFFETIWSSSYKGNIREMEMACKRIVHLARSLPINNRALNEIMFFSELSPAKRKTLNAQTESRMIADSKITNECL